MLAKGDTFTVGHSQSINLLLGLILCFVYFAILKTFNCNVKLTKSMSQNPLKNLNRLFAFKCHGLKNLANF